MSTNPKPLTNAIKKFLKTGYQHPRTPHLPLYPGIEIYKFSDGTIYHGDLAQNTPHGHGIMIYPDEIIYSGAFRRGDPCDSGVFVFNDGSYYVGQVNKCGPNGTGTYMGTPLGDANESFRSHQGPES